VPAVEPTPIPVGQAEVLREGSDVLIVGFGPIVMRGLEVADRDLFGGSRAVPIAGARVVDRNVNADLPSEQLVQGHTGHVSQQVPQGNVDSGQSTHLGTGGLVANIRQHSVGQRGHPDAVLSQQPWCHGFVDVPLDCVRAEVCLTDPTDARVRVDAQ
jgi:deoxyxylulose-5-phosphate synthase